MTENPKTVSPAAVDLARFGQAMLAYVRPVADDEGVRFAIHGADGEVLGFAPDHSSALGAIIMNGMRPVWLN